MLLITIFVELRVVARRSRTRAGSPQAFSLQLSSAVALRRTAWSEHGTASVNQMGKTHSKPLAACHGMGTAWAPHAMCELAFSCWENWVYYLINKTNLVHSFSYYIYIYQSLHVSGDYGPIIRRYNCVCATLGTCYSVWMTAWCAGWNNTNFHYTLRTRQSSTQNYKYQVTHKHIFVS
jgi:hypothetical protein